MIVTKWTDEEIAQLRELLSQGASASQAASMMSTARSRNAVIGFVHRHGKKLGIHFTQQNGHPPRQSVSKPSAPRKKAKGKKSPQKAVAAPPVPVRYQRQPKVIHPQFGRRDETKVKKPHLPPNEAVPSTIGMKRLTDLANDECRFAITSHNCAPADHRFCSAKVADPESKEGRLRSYCEHHAERVRSPGTRSEREAHKASSRIDGGPIRRQAQSNRY